MIIIVDTNEKSTNPKVVQSIEKHFSKVIIANLNAGDVNLTLDDGSVLAIERKMPYDFLASIADGRIFEQVECMARNAKYSAIIVTGTFTYRDKSDIVCIGDEDTNWKGASVRAVMNVIQYSGCPIVFCPPSKYCDMIAELYNLVNKPDERRAIHKNRIITFPPVDERVQFIAQLPGVGMKMAESLLKFAGMMDNNADIDGYGTVISALHWLSILSQIDKDSRPAGWQAKRILTQRKFLGLSSNQYIGLNEEKQEITE